MKTKAGVEESKHLYGGKTKTFKIYTNLYADLEYITEYSTVYVQRKIPQGQTKHYQGSTNG